ncbi:MAG: hypothetical protein OHK0052_23020 [Anaerolineales bacterium]
MSDLFDQVKSDHDPFKKLLSYVPGFKGYIERQDRRDADKILRERIGDEFEKLWQRLSSLQIALVEEGGLMYVDDVERAGIKIRAFIDRVRTAAYGHSSLFDSIKVNEEELARLYEYDLALFNSADELRAALDNLEASLGSDGLPAAIRHLTNLAQQCIDAFNRREQVIAPQSNAPVQ